MNKHITLPLLLLLILPISFASLEEDINQIQTKLESFVETNDENNLIIIGQHASTSELATLKVMQKKFPKIRNINVIEESELHKYDTTDKTLIFIGGPMQNQAASQELNNEEYIQTENKITGGAVVFLESESGKAIVFSDYTGFENLPHTGASKSPLNNFMPTHLVPIAATIIGLSFYWFIPSLLKFIAKVFTFMGSIKIMSFVRKREIKEKYIGFTVAGIRFKIREWVAILVAATVFACSLGYLYLSPQLNLMLFFILTIFTNFIVYGIRHFIRLYFDKQNKIHSEYMIWIWGAIITAVTAWLGNVFALAGYVVKSDDENDQKYQGRNAFIVNLVTFVFFVFLFFLNYKTPNIILQMTMLLALSITYLQMMPFKPFDGKNIYAWSKTAWWIFFIIITIIYIPINLII